MGKQEKNIINLFKNNIIKEEVITDIGEDCAVLYPMQSRNIIVSTDSISVGVHFNSNNTPYSIGRHLIETSLSDLACMGAEPVFAILNISFLKFDKKWVKKFARGVTETAKITISKSLVEIQLKVKKILAARLLVMRHLKILC